MDIVEIVKLAANDSTVRSPSMFIRHSLYLASSFLSLAAACPVLSFFLRRYTLSIVRYDIALPCFVKRET